MVWEPILADVRKRIPQERRVTVAFDRGGGLSPQLFARLQAQGYDVLTYRKGRKRLLPRSRFTVQGQQLEGAWREYEICDRQRVPVGKRPSDGSLGDGGKYFWMREVRVWRAEGHRAGKLLAIGERLHTGRNLLGRLGVQVTMSSISAPPVKCSLAPWCDFTSGAT